ncbi:MAG: hypothetical protein ACREGG_04645 [Candidatus Saccharimonadales bacterium]
MQRKELATVVTVAIASGLISLVIAGSLFNSPSQRTAKVPVVQAIQSSFPDVKNDPNYNFFLNESALDPTQPIQIGNSQNNTPFTNSQ